jgi:hypothetical protein
MVEEASLRLLLGAISVGLDPEVANNGVDNNLPNVLF